MHTTSETMLWLSFLLGGLCGIFVGVRYFSPPKHLQERRTCEFCILCCAAIMLPIFAILLYPAWKHF